MILGADSISVSYRGLGHKALDSVSAQVRSGEMVAVAGPNGSGKSTLFAALMGFIAPVSGSVTFEGSPVARWSRRRLAGMIGAMPQREETAFPLSVRDAVMLGRWSRLAPLARAGQGDHKAVDRALERVRLTGLADRSTDTLSGGEWQRVRVARALASEPGLLLLDEPGTALDLAHEMSLFELLTDLVRDGLGVMVITHHLNVAARHADRILLLDRGRLAAEGPPAMVINAELLSGVFGWPVTVGRSGDGAPHLIPLRRDETSLPDHKNGVEN